MLFFKSVLYCLVYKKTYLQKIYLYFWIKFFPYFCNFNYNLQTSASHMIIWSYDLASHMLTWSYDLAIHMITWPSKSHDNMIIWPSKSHDNMITWPTKSHDNMITWPNNQSMNKRTESNMSAKGNKRTKQYHEGRSERDTHTLGTVCSRTTCSTHLILQIKYTILKLLMTTLILYLVCCPYFLFL